MTFQSLLRVSIGDWHSIINCFILGPFSGRVQGGFERILSKGKTIKKSSQKSPLQNPED